MPSYVINNRFSSLCIRKLSSLDVPIPPPDLFERAIGYTGNNERYVAFYFDDEGQIFYEDCSTWDKGNTEPFELWSKVVPLWRLEIERAYIQQPDRKGMRNWLLLDRNARRVSFGPREAIIQILASQRPLPGRAGRPNWESIRSHVVIGITEWYTELFRKIQNLE